MWNYTGTQRISVVCSFHVALISSLSPGIPIPVASSAVASTDSATANRAAVSRRALVSGDTDVPAAPGRKGDLPLEPQQESPSSINEIQRKGSMEPQLQLQQQQHATVPRAVSVQSALDKEIEAQLIASVPASACLCDDVGTRVQGL